jgi:spermidine/putrescine transport system ATP-binding protein
MRLRFVDNSIKADMTKIYPQSILKDGVLYNKNGYFIPTEGVKVEIYFRPQDAQLSDDAEEGMVRGHINSIIYKGDHYSYVIRSKNDMDYYVDDEYLWNIGDFVSVIIPEDKIVYKIKG